MRVLILLAVALVGFAQVDIDSGSAQDKYFVGGSTSMLNNPPSNVQDNTFRYGEFTYNIPTQGGAQLVRFDFLEQTVGGPGQRIFQVRINDQVVFDQLDLLVSCGFMAPCSRTVVAMPDSANRIVISFKKVVRSAIVSHISVNPQWSGVDVNIVDPATGTKTLVGHAAELNLVPSKGVAITGSSVGQSVTLNLNGDVLSLLACNQPATSSGSSCTGLLYATMSLPDGTTTKILGVVPPAGFVPDSRWMPFATIAGGTTYLPLTAQAMASIQQTILPAIIGPAIA